MTEILDPPVPEAAAPPPEAVIEAPPKPTARQRSAWPVVFAVGFVLLAAGEAYLWHLSRVAPDEAAQIAALQAQLRQAPAPAPAPAPLAAVPADMNARLGTLSSQLDALQTLVNTDHQALAGLQADPATVAKLNTTVTALQTQDTADHAALATLQTDTAGLTKLTQKISLLSRLESARMALDAGEPLGAIPNAPPALAKFADAAPPTEAALILAFPAAARAAESASVSSDGKRSFWSSVLARVEGLITISNGTHVVVGAPAAGVMNQARAALNAGDLNGAVTVLDTLSQTTQAAMGTWLTQARDVLAARAAIISMAGQA
jgi:hypothetical protein